MPLMCLQSGCARVQPETCATLKVDSAWFVHDRQEPHDRRTILISEQNGVRTLLLTLIPHGSLIINCCIVLLRLRLKD